MRPLSRQASRKLTSVPPVRQTKRGLPASRVTSANRAGASDSRAAVMGESDTISASADGSARITRAASRTRVPAASGPRSEGSFIKTGDCVSAVSAV